MKTIPAISCLAVFLLGAAWAGPGEGLPAAKPLFRDPVFDGAADPVVVWNPHAGRWWMFYTNRRAKAEGLSGVTWVHGTPIGIAESADAGASWKYLGTAGITVPDELGGGAASFWAPEVVAGPDDSFHMFLSVVPGVFTDWNHPRAIVHLTSKDLRDWKYQSTLKLSSDRVIDACVARLPDGTWRMWYNNEKDRKSIYYADSPDLAVWTDKGKAVGDRTGEGPKVVRWKDAWWMITDVWDGLGVYRSTDALNWEPQRENLLRTPGQGADDKVKGGHADVVVCGERAWIFYFTHPGRQGPDAGNDSYERRRSSIQVAELKEEAGRLSCDRDRVTNIRLVPPSR